MANTKQTTKTKTTEKNTLKAGTKKPPKKDDLPPKDKNCSFCGKPSTYTQRLIAGPPPLNAFICDVCIEVCVNILMEDCPQDWRNRLISILAKSEKKNKTPPENKKPKAKKNSK